MASGGRIEKMGKNIAWGTFSRVVVMLYSFVSRTFFIKYLGLANNGIKSVFTEILTMLSFAELGIGTAMNFSLYKLVADKEIEIIKSYMQFYKNAYRVIALVIYLTQFVLTLCLISIVCPMQNKRDIYSPI